MTRLRTATALAAALLLGACAADKPASQQQTQAADPALAASAWTFDMTAIDGAPLPMKSLEGKVVLLVNTASQCGFTPQYESLQALYKRYEQRNFIVLGVPSGDFMNQEYAENAKIREFCESTFGITFPMTEKAHVKGADALPIYRWAKAKLGDAGVPGWNFHKILIGRDGQAIGGWGSRTKPDSVEIRDAIEKAVGEMAAGDKAGAA